MKNWSDRWEIRLRRKFEIVGEISCVGRKSRANAGGWRPLEDPSSICFLFFGGSRIVIRAGDTPLECSLPLPPPSIFSRGDEDARAHASVSPTSCHPASAISHYAICIRVATPLTSSPPGIPIKETHLRAIRAISPPLAHEGRAARRRDDVADRCWTEPTPYLTLRNEGNLRYGPSTASTLSFPGLRSETRNSAAIGKRGARNDPISFSKTRKDLLLRSTLNLYKYSILSSCWKLAEVRRWGGKGIE